MDLLSTFAPDRLFFAPGLTVLAGLATGARGLVFATVAGVMVYISIDELLPAAHQYGRSHEVLAGIASGMALMAASLLLLQ